MPLNQLPAYSPANVNNSDPERESGSRIASASPRQPDRSQSPPTSSGQHDAHRARLARRLGATGRHLQSIDAWVLAAPPASAHAYRAVAAKIRSAWADTEATLRITCSVITSLPPMPPHLAHLTLSGCSGLDRLPELSGLAHLTELHVMQCAGLTKGPDLTDCARLERFSMQDCRNVVTPPVLAGCARLRTLVMDGCESLAHPPILVDCVKLMYLTFERCRSLATPPDVSQCVDLEVLELSQCEALTEPPEVTSSVHLRVLNMRECGALRQAPCVRNCTALEELCMADCTLLRSPPTLFHHPGLTSLDMSGVLLTSLPENLMELPAGASVELTLSGLSHRVRNLFIAVVESYAGNGPTIHYDYAAPAAAEPVPLAEAVAVWKGRAIDGAPACAALWKRIEAEENAAVFSQFLGRLVETGDYNNPRLQGDFTQRVQGLIGQLEQDPKLRGTCFTIARGAVDTCGDRVALALLHMEIACMNRHAEQDVDSGRHDDDSAGLIKLAKGMFRLATLESLARQKVNSLQFVDEIEVYLGYIVRLSKEFALPVQMETMLYPNCASISDGDLEHARLALAGRGEGGEEGWRRFLENWHPMTVLLQRKDPEANGIEQQRNAELARQKLVLQTAVAELDPAVADRAAFDALQRRFAELEAGIRSVAQRDKWARIEMLVGEHAISLRD